MIVYRLIDKYILLVHDRAAVKICATLYTAAALNSTYVTRWGPYLARSVGPHATTHSRHHARQRSILARSVGPLPRKVWGASGNDTRQTQQQQQQWFIRKRRRYKNCIYKDLWSGIQGFVSAYWLLLYSFNTISKTKQFLFLYINYPILN